RPTSPAPTLPEPSALKDPIAITIAQNAYHRVSGFQPRSLASSLASASLRAASSAASAAEKVGVDGLVAGPACGASAAAPASWRPPCPRCAPAPAIEPFTCPSRTELLVIAPPSGISLMSMQFSDCTGHPERPLGVIVQHPRTVRFRSARSGGES